MSRTHVERITLDSPLGAAGRARLSLFAEGLDLARPHIDVFFALQASYTEGVDVYDGAATAGLGVRHSLFNDGLRLEYGVGLRHNVRVLLERRREQPDDRGVVGAVQVLQGLGIEGRLSLNARIAGGPGAEVRVGLDVWGTAGAGITHTRIPIDALSGASQPAVTPFSTPSGAAMLTLSINY